MDDLCDTCGLEAADLIDLHERGFGSSHQALSIALCPACLGERAVASWGPDQPERDRLLEALGQRHAPPQDRFTYLEAPDGDLFLLRLRPSWVDRHAAEHALAEA